MATRCEVCKIDIQDDFSFQGHIQGKRHLKNVQQSEIIQSIVERSIFVSRIPTFIPLNVLLQFFSQFGPIEKYRNGSSYLIIEYKAKEVAQFLLSRPIYFQNIKFHIKPRIIHDNKLLKSVAKETKNVFVEAINNTQDLAYENIKSIFEVESTFDDQLTAFLDKVAITNDEIETHYEYTCKKLEALFRNVFFNCKTYRFGSTVSGLGFKNCDLDIYMDCGFPLIQQNDNNTKSNHTAAAVFSEVKRLLFSRANLFSKIVPIPKAKTPIIKFTYVPTNISCDISFKNSLAVHNSQLIKFYLSLDPRFRPIMMIIKYWMCNYELRGRDKISKYALTLLFIFYLQQPHIKLAPPVIELKRRCVPEFVEGWQVNFDNTLKNYQQDSDCKDKSIPELLHGFFDFYASYNFRSNVICTVDGLSHSKNTFDVVDSLPESMDRYKEYLKTKENPVNLTVIKPMCVQDPNELNHNVTGNICDKYVETFQKYCSAVAEICVSAMEKNYRDLLPSMFSLAIKIKSKEQEINFAIQGNNFLNVGLSEDFETQTDIVDKNAFKKEHWCNLVLNLVKKFFEGVLHLQVQIIHPKLEQKQQKIEIQSDVHSGNHNKIIMDCKGEYCLWRDRKGKANVLDPSLSLLEKEIETSTNVHEYLTRNNKLFKYKIDFKCTILKKITDKNAELVFNLSDVDCQEKVFSELSTYIKHKMSHTLIKTLFHMRQYKKSID